MLLCQGQGSSETTVRCDEAVAGLSTDRPKRQPGKRGDHGHKLGMPYVSELATVHRSPSRIHTGTAV
jgi:hypothetical protein